MPISFFNMFCKPCLNYWQGKLDSLQLQTSISCEIKEKVIKKFISCLWHWSCRNQLLHSVYRNRVNTATIRRIGYSSFLNISSRSIPLTGKHQQDHCRNHKQKTSHFNFSDYYPPLKFRQKYNFILISCSVLTQKYYLCRKISL